MPARRVAVAVLVPASALFAACNAFDAPAGRLVPSSPSGAVTGTGRTGGISLGQAGFEAGGQPTFVSAGAPSIAGTAGMEASIGGAGVGGTGPGDGVGGSGGVPLDASVPEDAGPSDDAGVDAGP